MTSLLADTGRALYGERWQTALAADLGVSDRTVRRWLAGAYDPEPGVYADLLRIVTARRGDLTEIEARLKRAA